MRTGAVAKVSVMKKVMSGYKIQDKNLCSDQSLDLKSGSVTEEGDIRQTEGTFWKLELK